MSATLTPTMRGTLALGQTLTPVAAQWTGGWGDDVSRLSLYVCRTEGGDDCVVSGGALRAEHQGRYAFSVVTRTASNDHVPAAPADGTPAATVPTRTAIVVVSSAAGPIAADVADAPPIPAPTAPGGGGSTPGTPGTPGTPQAKKPKVKLRKRALRRGKRVTVGSVTCATRCRVRLSVGDGRRTVRRTLNVTGTKQLVIVNGSKLRKKVRLRVVVTVDGKRLKTGRVRG